jgi:Uma2 family endonuclease
MMIASPSFNYFSPEEYLAAEDVSSLKHEYRQGHIYAMAGASEAHVTIAGNIFLLLRNHLRGGSCRVFISDMKLCIGDRQNYYYPDVMVTCDERDKASTKWKCFPSLVVEVLSDSTEGFDRGDKFLDYQGIETLQEYLLVSQKRRRVDCFRRNAEGLWVMKSAGIQDRLELNSVGLAISIADVYEDVEPG